jgi:replication factor C subunit 3/5
MDIDDLIDDGISNSHDDELNGSEINDVDGDHDEGDDDNVVPFDNSSIPQAALAMFTSSYNTDGYANSNFDLRSDQMGNFSRDEKNPDNHGPLGNPSTTTATSDIRVSVDLSQDTEDSLIDCEDDKVLIKDKGKLPWVEKYRPARLDELIDHKEKIDTIRNFIKNNEFPHLLLYGPPGTGKTSLIQAAAREMYGPDYRLYILELNASDHRGIETIRSKIPNFVRTKSDKIRLVILDEADAMTSEAQGALRRTMEKYIKICRFCIICNKVNKIIPGLQSRTSQMRFGMLDARSIEPRIKDISIKEGVEITDDAIKTLIELQKDFRQIINTLQCLHYVRIGEGTSGSTSGSDPRNTGNSASETSETSETSKAVPKYPIITAEYIHKYLGKPSKEEVMNLVHDILSKPFTEIYEKMQQIYRDNKWNPIDLIQKINNFVIESAAFSEEQKSYLTQKFSKLENMIVNGRDTEIQLAALIGILKKSLIKYRK